MPKIVSVGSINTDLVTYTPRFPLPGETLTGTSFSSCPGGKGANQCVIAAKLSSTPNYAGMIGCVGSDAYGVAQLSNFATLNADTAHLITCPDPDISSGLATISIDEAGENSIIIIPGANNYLSQDHIADIPPEYFADTTHALFQFEILPSTNMAAMSLIKTSNPTTTTICNPAPALPLSTFPPNFFQHCDILAPNQTELSLLTDNAPSTSVAECVAAAQTLLTTPSTGLSNIIGKHVATHKRVNVARGGGAAAVSQKRKPRRRRTNYATMPANT